MVEGARERIIEVVSEWPGIAVDDGEIGELAFTFGRREIGHLHGDRAADFSFPRRVWDELAAEGRIVEHPVFPGRRGPAARRIETDDDVRDVVELLRLNYERLRASRPGGEAATRFGRAELDFLRTQRLGRLATVDEHGAPQNNPVGFFVDDATHSIVIGGISMASTRKFRNVKHNPNVALVIDELASDPWVVRGVEIRGTADALVGVDPPMRGMSRDVIRIHPRRVISWGLD